MEEFSDCLWRQHHLLGLRVMKIINLDGDTGNGNMCFCYFQVAPFLSSYMQPKTICYLDSQPVTCKQSKLIAAQKGPIATIGSLISYMYLVQV